MQKAKVSLDNMTLIGLTVRTNNKNEMSPDTSKIGELVGAYWGNQVANEFKDRVNPGVTYTVYTDFEVYDERAMDPNNAVIDIYIGIQ